MNLPYRGAILWDLDGTLVFTAKGGRIALSAAIAEHTGRAVDLADLATAGLTDVQSATAALEAVGVTADAALLQRVREGYEQRLPGALVQRGGRVLPGAHEALAGLSGRGRILNLLLTGNTSVAAKAKLERYGLADWFPHGGGFCEGPGDRLPIARRALAIAANLVEGFVPAKALVIGDTPRDVECASAIGVRAFGVASGDYPAEALMAAGAWRAGERIPQPDVLEHLVLAERGERSWTGYPAGGQRWDAAIATAPAERHQAG